MRSFGRTNGIVRVLAVVTILPGELRTQSMVDYLVRSLMVVAHIPYYQEQQHDSHVNCQQQ
jgi:hypothetical protein